MARNYTADVLRVIGGSMTSDTVLDVLGEPDTTTMAKWNTLAGTLSDPGVCDLVMLAFAAGRNFENAILAKQIDKLFS